MKKKRIYEVRYLQKFQGDRDWAEYCDRRLGAPEIYDFVVALRKELLAERLGTQRCIGVKINDLKILAETAEGVR